MGKSGLGTAFFGTFFFSLNVKHFFFDGLSFHAVMAANMLGYTRADALVVVVVKRCGPFPPLSSSSSSSALTLMIAIIIFLGYRCGWSMLIYRRSQVGAVYMSFLIYMPAIDSYVFFLLRWGLPLHIRGSISPLCIALFLYFIKRTAFVRDHARRRGWDGGAAVHGGAEGVTGCRGVEIIFFFLKEKRGERERGARKTTQREWGKEKV